MIDGIDSINCSKYQKIIKKRILKISKEKHILDGIPYATVKLIPESGYFMLIDFTNISKYCNIKTEKELLKYLYLKCNVKFLVGQSFSWPNKNEIIIRISYSLNEKDLIMSFFKINLAIKEITNYETNRNNCQSQ